VATSASTGAKVGKYVRGGFGFATLRPLGEGQLLDQLVEQAFNCNAEQLTRAAPRFGFTLRQPHRAKEGSQVTLFLSK
jgi:hypothetical protein